nr:hypothetical protein [Flavobacterium sp. ASV13]
MKSKLYFLGLIFISLSIFSCSTDDYENTEVQNDNLKLVLKGKLKEDLNTKKADSTLIMSTDSDGEPSNPKPPRKD